MAEARAEPSRRRAGPLRFLILLFLLAIAPPAPAQSPQPASIGQAGWLAGRWVGEGLGGTLEEVWSPPQGGQMVGHFALLRHGAPVFYEMLLIDEQPGGLRMRVKHFNPDFTGWEDRGGWHSFEPVSAGAQSLTFRGLALRLEGEQLLITLTLRDRATGATTDQLLRLRRAPL